MTNLIHENNELNTEMTFEVLRKFRMIFGSARNHFKKIEDVCGISGSQLWILKEVDKAPGQGVTELANKLSIHQTTSSLLVEKLVTKNLIIKERSKEDQRRVGLYVTEEAKNILNIAPGPAEGLLPSAVKSLSKETLELLNKGLADVLIQLGGYDEEMANQPLADM
jgi:DNA-binding MarR family transcriptional regulator